MEKSILTGYSEKVNGIANDDMLSAIHAARNLLNDIEKVKKKREEHKEYRDKLMGNPIDTVALAEDIKSDMSIGEEFKGYTKNEVDKEGEER